MTEKNKGGRPIKWTAVRKEKLCDDLEEWLEDPRHFWFKDFINEQRMSMDMWYKIKKENSRLKAIINKAKLKQENFLVKGALFSKIHPGFTMFLLKANHKDIYGDISDDKKGTTINVYSKKFSHAIEQEVAEDENI